MTQRPFASHSQQRQISLGKLLTYAILAAWSFVCLFPMYWVAVTSLKGETDIMDGPVYLPFIDFTPSLKAWAFILGDTYDNLLPRFFNSAIIGLTSTVITTALGGMAVYGFTRFKWRTSLPSKILFAILASRILPPVVIVLPLYVMAQLTGTLDTRFALIFAYTAVNLPVAVWLMQPVLGPRATDQEEAALLDGASHVVIFFTVVLPMIAASAAAVALLIFVLCWNEYIFAVNLAGDRAMTLPPWMVGQMSMKEAQIGGEAEEWANLSAATVLMAAPLLACAVYTRRALNRMDLWKR
jgi:multiple sugar transport system permease protein